MQVVGDHARQVGGGLMKEGVRCHIKKLRFYSVTNNHAFSIHILQHIKPIQVVFIKTF